MHGKNKWYGKKIAPKSGFVFIVLCYFFLTNICFSVENERVYPINKIISLFKLDVEYDLSLGQITLKKHSKRVVVLIDNPFILIEDRKIYLNSMVCSEQGRISLPIYAANLIVGYFSDNKVKLKDYTIKKTEIREESIQNGEFLLNLKSEFEGGITKTDEVDADSVVPDKKADSSKMVEEPVTADEPEEKAVVEVDVKNRYIHEKEPDVIDINAIIIDAGHGGQDPGAVGYSGVKEKDIVLRAALILSDKLKQAYPNKKIILTRSKDEFIPLDKRAGIANYVFNKYGASIFVSIHVNASRSSRSYGFETWYLVEEYRRKIIKKGAVSDDVDVEKVLNSMLNDEIYKESRDLAAKINNNLEKRIGSVSINRGIKEQTYFVIKKSIMPAVLVEIGFNTNKYEEIRLTKYSYLNKIAAGITEGVQEFIDDYERTNGYTK